MVLLAAEKWQASRAHVHTLPIHNQAVVHREEWACPPPSIAGFANGLSARAMPGSRRLWERFQWRRVLPLSVYFIPGSIQRGAFFLTVEGRKEAMPVV